jgi:WD40 repeat protein
VIATEPQSPYKGLVPFEDSELDALFFFGREHEAKIISANVLAARLTVLYGPSGVGKTSVLRAGVAHRLRQLARENVEQRGHPEFAAVVFDAWSDEPVTAIRQAVRDELAALFGSALLDDREGESLADTLERWTSALACDVLLILDQAEEYFVYHAEESGFADELPDLVTRPRLRVRVLLALRDDALAKLDRFKGRIPNLFANYLRLDHLDRRSARDAIVKPVERFNDLGRGDAVEVEPPLIEAVLSQTATGKVDLGDAGRGLAPGEADESRIEAPYLQLVLERIWEEERAAGSLVLRADTLARLGDAEAIVRTHLRRAVEDLTAEEKGLAADVFRYLVTPSGTKIAHGVADLADYVAVDEGRLLPVLSTLDRARIVRPVDGAGADGARYEIFHDVLAGAVLGWRREQEVERERRAGQRRQRRLAAVATAALAALALMTAVAIYALAQRRQAQDQHRGAEARALLAESLNQLDVDPELSLLLALEAARTETTRQVENVLRRAVEASRLRTVERSALGAEAIASPPGRRARVGGRLLPARGVLALARSPDGELAATGSRDHVARLWSADTGRLRHVLRGHTGAVTAVAFSPDGKMLVTASRDGTGRVWTTRNGLLYATLVGHTNPLTSAAFNARGDLVATGSGDRTARIWGTSTTAVGKPFLALRGHRNTVTRVQFAENGQLVTFSVDGTRRLWDPEPEPRLRVIARDAAPEPGPTVADAQGKRARARGAEIVVRDFRTGKEVRLVGHAKRVTSVHFDPAGERLLTTSEDSDARIWDVESGRTLHVLRGHFGTVNDAGFSRDGRWIVTAGPISAGLWRSDADSPHTYLRNAGQPIDAKFVGERQVVIAARDGTIRAWTCVTCGTLDDLVALAERRLARTGRTLTPDERRRFLSG